MNRVMPKKSTGPLTEAHLRTLNKLIETCTATLDYCRVCEECNLDVSPEQRTTREQLDMAQRIKARFFPTAK